MGLSSSKSKTKSSSTENATVTPTVPEWISQPLQGYAGKAAAFLNSDPTQFVAGAAPLQQKAFDAAGRLGSGQKNVGEALALASQAAAAPAPRAAVATYAAPQLGPAVQSHWSGYDAPVLGPAAQTAQVDLNPTRMADSESLLDGFERYLDPATEALVSASLRNYDAESGRQGAAMQAAAARAGAFGGSRLGIAQGEFAAGTDRNRALAEHELRERAFSQAAQMADSDARRRQETGLANSGAENLRSLTQGQMNLQRLLANSDAQNQSMLAQAGLTADAARFGAEASNASSMFNAGQSNDIMKTEAALQEQAAAANAAAENAGAQFNSQQEAQAANRMLEAAGLIGNLGLSADAATRADLSSMADLGAQQRAILAAQLGAPLSQLQAAGQLYGMLPYNSFTGQQTSGSSSGTSTTKTSPSLFNQALAAAAAVGSFVP